jgi:hypothetical protein
MSSKKSSAAISPESKLPPTAIVKLRATPKPSSTQKMVITFSSDSAIAKEIRRSIAISRAQTSSSKNSSTIEEKSKGAPFNLTMTMAHAFK